MALFASQCPVGALKLKGNWVMDKLSRFPCDRGMTIFTALLIFAFMNIIVAGRACIVLKRPEHSCNDFLFFVKFTEKHLASDVTLFTINLEVLAFEFVTLVLVCFVPENVFLPLLLYCMAVLAFVGRELVPVNFKVTVPTVFRFNGYKISYGRFFIFIEFTELDVASYMTDFA
jgi:hypothetical protein